jgi:hypothetical protein
MFHCGAYRLMGHQISKRRLALVDGDGGMIMLIDCNDAIESRRQSFEKKIPTGKLAVCVYLDEIDAL